MTPDLEAEIQQAGPLTSAIQMQYLVASHTSSMLGHMDELIALSRDFSNPDAQRAIEAEFATIDAIVTRGQILLSFFESRIDRHDPGFIKFRAETVPPEQRNWRTLRRDWLAYQRDLAAKKRWGR